MAEDGDRRDEAREAATPPPPAEVGRRRRRLLLAVLLIPVALVLAAFGVDRAIHQGQILRGVVVVGVDLGGMDRGEAEQALKALEVRLRAQPLLVTVRQTQIELQAEQVDFALSMGDLVGQALVTGREGNLLSQLGWWLGRWGGPVELAAVGRVDADKLGALIVEWQVEGIDDPPFEGAVEVRDDQPVAVLPRSGYVVDREQATALVAASFGEVARGTLDLPLVEQQPVRGASQVHTALAQAKQLLSGPIELTAKLPDIGPDPSDGKPGKKNKKKGKPKPGKSKVGRKDAADPDGGPTDEVRFRFTGAALAKALRSRAIGGPPPAIEVYLDPDALESALEPARAKLEHPPVDAVFVIGKREKVTVRPSQPGAVIDAKNVAAKLLELGTSEGREGTMPIEVGAQPKLTTAAAEALHIDGLVKKFTTAHPCCRPRVENIHRMADLIDGVLLQPGERFSINEHVGERTPAKGFAPAPTIVHGKMKDTIGGGVSQFATTFFNAAFHGGYEIIERQPHSYYFRRYPMGHEATLSFPKPDVIIRNDTEAGLLIRATYTGVSITVKLFGNNGGRKVKRKVSHPRDVTEPPIEYIADPELDPDEEKVKVRGQVGWTVIVARITEYPDGETKKEQRKVVYRPRVRKVRVHPCKIPKGEDGHTGEPCPEPEEEDEEDGEDGEDGEIEPIEDDPLKQEPEQPPE